MRAEYRDYVTLADMIANDTLFRSYKLEVGKYKDGELGIYTNDELTYENIKEFLYTIIIDDQYNEEIDQEKFYAYFDESSIILNILEPSFNAKLKISQQGYVFYPYLDSNRDYGSYFKISNIEELYEWINEKYNLPVSDSDLFIPKYLPNNLLNLYVNHTKFDQIKPIKFLRDDYLVEIEYPEPAFESPKRFSNYETGHFFELPNEDEQHEQVNSYIQAHKDIQERVQLSDGTYAVILPYVSSRERDYFYAPHDGVCKYVYFLDENGQYSYKILIDGKRDATEIRYINDVLYINTTISFNKSEGIVYLNDNNYFEDVLIGGENPKNIPQYTNNRKTCFKTTDNKWIELGTKYWKIIEESPQTTYPGYRIKLYWGYSNDGVYNIHIKFPKVSHSYTWNGNIGKDINNNYFIQIRDINDTSFNYFSFNKDYIDAVWDQAIPTPTYVAYNNQILAFDIPPVTENDRTLIPLRFLFETMGATVDWKENTQEAIVQYGDKTVTVQIDNTVATVNGEPCQLDVPARLINGKTMVPLRFVSEGLGYTVTWDEENRIAEIL